MYKRWGLLVLGTVLAVVAWMLYIHLGIENFDKITYSIIAVVLIFAVMTELVDMIIVKRLKIKRTKYIVRKILSIMSFAILLIFLTLLWIKNPVSLLVAYGIVGAGIAIAMQDVIKNFAGGIIILFNQPYKIGDRIEINGKFGDVMDIGVQYTTLLELRGWVNGDQATGRIIRVPNSFVLSHPINNYTDDHDFIWDEITIPLTYDSDWKSAERKFLEIIIEETRNMSLAAGTEIGKLEEKYYLEKRPTEPSIFIKLTDNWIELHIRYITETRKRRIINNNLSRKILEMISKSKRIRIASQTFDIVGFPGRKNI